MGIVEDYKIPTFNRITYSPFVVEKYVKYEYEVAPWFAAMPKEMFGALETTPGWQMLITVPLR